MRDHFKKIHNVIKSFQDSVSVNNYNEVIKPFQDDNTLTIIPERIPEDNSLSQSPNTIDNLRDSQIQAKYERMIKELSEESLQDSSHTSESLKPQVLDYNQLESFKDETLLKSFNSNVFSEKRNSLQQNQQVFNYNSNQTSHLFKKEKSNKSPEKDYDSPFKFPTLKSTPPDSQFSEEETNQENLLPLEESNRYRYQNKSPDFKENLLDVMCSQETGQVKIRGLITGESEQSFKHFPTQIHTKENSPLKINVHQFFNSTHEVNPLNNDMSFENLLNDEVEEKIEHNEVEVEIEEKNKTQESPFLNQIYQTLNRRCKENSIKNSREQEYGLFLNKSQQNSESKKKKANMRYNSISFSKNKNEDSPQVNIEISNQELESFNPPNKSRTNKAKYLTVNRKANQTKVSQNVSFNETSILQEGNSFVEYKNQSMCNFKESHFSSIQSSVSKKRLKKNNSQTRSKTPVNRNNNGKQSAGVAQIQRKIEIDQKFRDEKKEKLNKKLQKIQELNNKRKVDQEKLVLQKQQKQKEKSLVRRPVSAMTTNTQNKKKQEQSKERKVQQVEKQIAPQQTTYSSLFRKKSIDVQSNVVKKELSTYQSRSKSKIKRPESQIDIIQKKLPVPKLDMSQIHLQQDQQDQRNKKVQFASQNQPQRKSSIVKQEPRQQNTQVKRLFQKTQNWKPVIGNYKGSHNISPEKLNLCHIKYKS